MKRIRKMIITILLVCAMTTGIVLPEQVEHTAMAASTIKLSASSIKLANGDTKKLTLKEASGTVKWKSNKTSVAKVSSKGKITAIKEGSAVITATYKGNSYKCNVIVTKKTMYSSASSLTIFRPMTIIISSDIGCDKDETLTCIVSDTTVATASWDDYWEDSNNIKLTICPQTLGSATIKIISDKSDQVFSISIKVVSDTNYDDDKAMTAKQIYANYKLATTEVNTDIAVGSGFYIGKGKLVTNYHVINGATSISVMNIDGKVYTVSKILGYDETLDIAILSVPCTDNSYLKLNTHGLTTGENVYAFGNPLGLTDTFTTGVIENTSRYEDSEPFIQSSAAISSGNSGGALVNAFGEVIGINTATYTEGQNLNLAIPIHQIYMVSTYSPISVSDFVEMNLPSTTTTSGEIYENTSYSNNYATAQTANVGYYIYGTYALSQRTTWPMDFYKFTVTTPGDYELQVCDLSGNNGLYTGFYTEDGVSVYLNEAPYNMSIDCNNTESIFWAQAYLPAGTYYLVVFNNSKVVKTAEINYKAAIVAY